MQTTAQSRLASMRYTCNLGRYMHGPSTHPTSGKRHSWCRKILPIKWWLSYAVLLNGVCICWNYVAIQNRIITDEDCIMYTEKPAAQLPIYYAYFRSVYSFKTLGTMDFIVNQCGLKSRMPDDVPLVTPNLQEYARRHNRRYVWQTAGETRLPRKALSLYIIKNA